MRRELTSAAARRKVKTLVGHLIVFQVSSNDIGYILPLLLAQHPGIENGYAPLPGTWSSLCFLCHHGVNSESCLPPPDIISQRTTSSSWHNIFTWGSERISSWHTSCCAIHPCLLPASSWSEPWYHHHRCILANNASFHKSRGKYTFFS